MSNRIWYLLRWKNLFRTCEVFWHLVSARAFSLRKQYYLSNVSVLRFETNYIDCLCYYLWDRYHLVDDLIKKCINILRFRIIVHCLSTYILYRVINDIMMNCELRRSEVCRQPIIAHCCFNLYCFRNINICDSPAVCVNNS